MRWLGLLVVVLGCAACSKESRICSKMNATCGTSAAACEKIVDTVKAQAGEGGLDAMLRCFDGEPACSSALACTAGVGARGVTDSAKEFFEGLGKDSKPK